MGFPLAHCTSFRLVFVRLVCPQWLPSAFPTSVVRFQFIPCQIPYFARSSRGDRWMGLEETEWGERERAHTRCRYSPGCLPSRGCCTTLEIVSRDQIDRVTVHGSLDRRGHGLRDSALPQIHTGDIHLLNSQVTASFLES